MAEVLITLGIIGVVAAMTMPTLIQNYKKSVYVNQLKKTTSVWGQAVKRVMADDEVDNVFNTEIFYNMKLADFDSCVWNSFDNTTCAPFVEFGKYFNAEIKQVPSDYSWSFYTGAPDNTPKYMYVFLDGTLGCVYGAGDNGFLVEVDINGYKGPNTYGRDLFIFAINKNGLITSAGKIAEGDGSYASSSKCPDKTADADAACFARIVENGWKIDY